MSTVEAPRSDASPSGAPVPRFLPVKYWAIAGAIITAFMAYILLKWITGPNFTRVDPGPTPLPQWMKVSLIAWQIIMPATWLFFVYRFIVRPWFAERRISVEGLFVIAGTTIAFQDVMTNWNGPWILYNAAMVNRGSWYNEIPGWPTYGEPGHMAAAPLLWLPFAHGFSWLLFAMLGRKFINAVRARRPQTGYGTLAVATFVLMLVLDVVLEVVVMMPFGLFTYPGGHGPLAFGGHYNAFPANEAFFICLFFTFVTLLYTYRNDKGETLVERGIEEMGGGPVTKSAVRSLAMIAIFQLGLLVVYTVPLIALFRPHEFPQDVLDRSYFLNGICGAGQKHPCP